MSFKNKIYQVFFRGVNVIAFRFILLLFHKIVHFYTLQFFVFICREASVLTAFRACVLWFNVNIEALIAVNS